MSCKICDFANSCSVAKAKHCKLLDYIPAAASCDVGILSAYLRMGHTLWTTTSSGLSYGRRRRLNPAVRAAAPPALLAGLLWSAGNALAIVAMQVGILHLQ